MEDFVKNRIWAFVILVGIVVFILGCFYFSSSRYVARELGKCEYLMDSVNFTGFGDPNFNLIVDCLCPILNTSQYGYASSLTLGATAEKAYIAAFKFEYCDGNKAMPLEEIHLIEVG